MIKSIIKRCFFDKANNNWEKAWEYNLTPWETNSYSPPLKEALNTLYSKKNEVNNLKALVPGCGSGHDCFFLSNYGFKRTVGIDISNKAIAIAIENSKMFNCDVSDNRLSFKAIDFFKYKEEKYDFIFDYLFFAAIEPKLRIEWGNSISHLLNRNANSALVTLIFPTFDGHSTKNIGPPYQVDISDYENVLLPKGFKLLTSFQANTSIKPRFGRETIAVWKYE